jgi:hypothetical protein
MKTFLIWFVTFCSCLFLFWYGGVDFLERGVVQAVAVFMSLLVSASALRAALTDE